MLFIHLGGDTVIRSKDVITILDQQVREASEITEAFLQFNLQQQKVEQISKDTTKSIVITSDKIFFSPIASVTLKRRAQVITDLDLTVE